ncbi:Histidine kinase osmosensor, variant 2 [Basidiobolus ranarum]|uniref:Histidine kinase osmosensor, variant 2 n=1 Tax=Basidiobolus ranarum TaxID=34480 RepID=A0ABR2W1E1_9FUNG
MSDQTSIAWVTMVADVFISMSYMAIPIEIFFFQRTLTLPLPMLYKSVLLLFEAFITACGATHFVTMWNPFSNTDLALCIVKVITAVVSTLTAALLIRVFPKAFSLPAKAAWLEEELGSHMRHEQSLRMANDLLLKFRKVTQHIRKTLDTTSVCQTAVFELSVALGVGCAIYMKEGDIYTCIREDYRHLNDQSLRHSDKDIFWQKIDISTENKVINRMTTLSYACCLNKRDLCDMVGDGVNIPFKAAMGARFQLGEANSGFVMIYSSDETWSLPEQEVELFEDIVGQIEIALQQSAQLKHELDGKFNETKSSELTKVEEDNAVFRLSTLRQNTTLSLPPPPPFSQNEEKDDEVYNMEPLNGVVDRNSPFH